MSKTPFKELVTGPQNLEKNLTKSGDTHIKINIDSPQFFCGSQHEPKKDYKQVNFR